ncbi:GAF domain-containing protein [Halobacterium salinarum]|uniref:GAF domain protein n=3 Tax=Halobacterium salinarum TaxID=2242 RepID=Q9HRD3_HALSA|nr:GAF domain-containing protein [Halobacterium salinarum]AAG19225.1 conserved hypothetical protein [Halobacterium salinarum NRC-1]MBB6090068.1 putative methionine-R-sulfoxide reductase with GAF domain [Halobacterium salinarum]MDL0120783.1 GAF domain-containing protein [Halobacterium salinarum]MDL0141923.1 GAF domain-containing protein [Halobacterium salinarum]UEB92650.1 GAF domain-containing protein [Halobacterium salinarum NRC-34001]
MDHDSYLRAIGLPEYADAASDAAHRGAALVARPPHTTITTAAVEDHYTYPVPSESTPGTARDVGPADDQYNLAPICGLEYDPEQLRDHPNTARLAALAGTVDALAEELPVDWLGIYRRAADSDGHPILVKEAYTGAPSRAVVPLTDSVAARSINAAVGRSGEAVVVDDTAAHDGPGNERDSAVASECCCPVLAGDDVVGIVDAESHTPEFFTPERVLTIVGACAGLADSELLTPPRVEQ